MAFTWSLPAFTTLNQITDYYNQHSSSMTQAYKDYYNAKYLDPLQKLIGWNPNTNQWDQSKWPTYTPVQWGEATDPNSYAGRYSQLQTGMSGLLTRIAAGPQSSDISQAQADVAQTYGYSPASWTALLEGMPDRINASNVMTGAASISMGLENTAFGQEQAAALKASQRSAEAAVGKQLEAIFGERGGLAGFQAAYDLTSQLQSSFLQQQSQYHLAILDRSIAAVNAENGYYQDLISKGAVQAEDYLRIRWDSLQQGYQGYLQAMDQTMQEWTTREQMSEQQYNAQAKVITDQVNAITAAMAQEMGMDQASLDYVKTQYEISVQPALDAAALDEARRAQRDAQTNSIADGMIAGGIAVAAVGGAPGLVIGGIMAGAGALIKIAEAAC